MALSNGQRRSLPLQGSAVQISALLNFFATVFTSNYEMTCEKPVKNLSARQRVEACKRKKAGAATEDGRTSRRTRNGYEKGSNTWFALRENSD